MNEDDGFTLVTRQNTRRKRNRKVYKSTNRELVTSHSYDDDTCKPLCNKAEQVKKIDKCKKRIFNSKFYGIFFATLENSINNWYASNIASTKKCNRNIETVNPKTKISTVQGTESSINQHQLASSSNVDETLTNISSCLSPLAPSHLVEETGHSDLGSSSCSSNLPPNIVLNRESTAAIKEIVCYGLGNFLSSASARYQLALLLILIEKLQIKNRCSIFDPVFTSDEKEILQDFGLQIITENEDCKRCVQMGTLFYMVHCERDMYNNLLASNWPRNNLRNVIIVGNCFSNYSLRLSCQRAQLEAFYIYNALTFVDENIIPNTFDYKDIFNDSAILYFKVLNNSNPDN
ncbi:SRR1-like protein [Trichoplax sp. H2]|nr:SRR1-like protein [Trichoplax sp. H2]|eukprot:RDD38227.1 SRR1-like protein [Trichoplax sp. H2]